MQWMMLQQERPEDFVIATGKQESVRKFVELTAIELGWQGIKWEGVGMDEVGRRMDNGEIVIKIDKNYFRPSEVETLLGDASKAREKLGWEPKINLKQLISEMVKNDENEARLFSQKN